MFHTRVKICGITRPEDALFASNEGVDAVGLVFYANSPRCVSVSQALDICRVLPAFVTSVALFKDADRAAIDQVISQMPVDLLQFHGSESADFCRQFNKPYIKAIGMKGVNGGSSVLKQQAEMYSDARGLLVDGHAPGADGGGGQSFEWNSITSDLPIPLILAGGLDANNVAGAILTVKPYAVDVSSGVESEKGIKDASRVSEFMRQVTLANRELSEKAE